MSDDKRAETLTHLRQRFCFRWLRCIHWNFVMEDEIILSVGLVKLRADVFY